MYLMSRVGNSVSRPLRAMSKLKSTLKAGKQLKSLLSNSKSITQLQNDLARVNKMKTPKALQPGMIDDVGVATLPGESTLAKSLREVNPNLTKDVSGRALLNASNDSYQQYLKANSLLS
jgi:hypothetical protein